MLQFMANYGHNNHFLCLSDPSTAEIKLKRLLQEHCDGNRNIFHTAVTICIPSTNKDTETGK